MARTVDYTELDKRAIDLIQSNENGVPQNDLWKMLSISSRDCTRLVLRLMEKHLIFREEGKNGKSKTYIIKIQKDAPEPVEDLKFDPMLLMAGETIVPCVACSEECNVAECPMLEEWVYDLAFSEIK